jgi:hypothetical protein
MQFHTHLLNNETATISIRLNKTELQSLRDFMHTDPTFENVMFPRGVVLLKRGMGWYRLDVLNDYDAVTKLKCALGIVKRWHFEFKAAMRRDQQLAAARANPNVVIQSFHSDTNSFQIRTKEQRCNSAPLPASPNQLQALVAKFGHHAR